MATVTLTQQVVVLNVALELAIDTDEGNFPGAAHPETSREMLNDLRLYINAILPIATNDLYNKLISSLAYARALQLPVTSPATPLIDQQFPAFLRNIFIEDFAVILNANPANFYNAAKNGMGICKTRPQLLAMFLINPPTITPALPNGTAYINPIIELANVTTAAQRTANETAIETAFNLLTEENKIDIFNLLRFPKSHFTMAKKIFDGLETKYFPTENITQTLADAAKTKRLVTEYEKGLIAFTSAGALSISPFSGKVQALINNAVWRIQVATLTGVAAGAGVPLPSVPAQVGIPEKFPTHTFVADAATEEGFGAGSVGFLKMAGVYHNIFAQNAQTVVSFESLIQTLSAATSTIGRLRLVTHFGGEVTAPVPDGVIFLPFFTGQVHGDGSIDNRTKHWHFQYGISDDEGLKAYLENEYLSFQSADFLSGFRITTAPNTTGTPVHKIILDTLQSNNDSVLVPLGIQVNDPNPAAALGLLIQWASNLFMLSNMNIQVIGRNSTHLAVNISPLVQTAIENFINAKILSLQTATGVLIAANVNPLVARIASLNPSQLTIQFATADMPLTMPDVYVDNHDAMRTALAIVKTRLNNSFVDIRGCRIGQDLRFLGALRTFLGNVGNEPIVSGPEWFQGFGKLGNATLNSEGQLDDFFNSGYTVTSGGRVTRIFTAADVQREYSAWAGRIGINSQLSFWRELFNGEEFDFLTLNWRTQLPPIGMESAKLIALGTGNYPAVMNTIHDIFKIPAATGPSVADINTFNTNFIPHVVALQTIFDTVTGFPAATTQTEFQNQLAAIQAIAALSIVSQTLPTPVPATLAKEYLISCIDVLKRFLGTQSALLPIFTAIKTKLANPESGFRYMLGIGLGLVVQEAAHEGNTRLVYYTADQDNAMKSWLKIHWETPLPATAITSINALNPIGEPAIDNNGTTDDPNDDIYNDSVLGLFYSSLSSDHSDTLNATNPTAEFHQHIIKVP